MGYFKFKEGRQGTGYETMTLSYVHFPKWLTSLTGILGYDAYIIKYKDGSSIPPHIDGVSEGMEHHRLNIVIKKPDSGGVFVCPNAFRFIDRLFYFRPDIMSHEVTVCKGTRFVFSFGWIKIDSDGKNKNKIPPPST